MKLIRILSVALLLCIVTSTASGQKIKYRDVKDLYSWRQYVEEVDSPKYFPAGAAVLNYFFPGAGHVYIGEWLRGSFFFAGTMASSAMIVTGIIMAMSVNENGNSMPGSRTMLYAGLGTGAAFMTWSIVDVIRVAGIKNVAFDRIWNEGVSWQLQPYIDQRWEVGRSSILVYGLSAKISF